MDLHYKWIYSAIFMVFKPRRTAGFGWYCRISTSYLGPILEMYALKKRNLSRLKICRKCCWKLGTVILHSFVEQGWDFGSVLHDITSCGNHTSRCLHFPTHDMDIGYLISSGKIFEIHGRRLINVSKISLCDYSFVLLCFPFCFSHLYLWYFYWIQ